MEGASMDALQERLLRLESLVYGASGSAPAHSTQTPPPSETVLAKTQTIQQGLHRLEHSTPHLHDFYNKYRRLRHHIDLQQEQGEEETGGEAGSKREEVNDLQERMAGVAARAAVVCSYEEEARQVEQLTRMLNDNLRTLENDRLKEVPIMMRELKPIEAVHWDQVEAASLLNAQFNELLNSYNDLINLVSQQFLVWHERVSKWEKQLGLAQEEAIPPPIKKRGKATNAGKRPPRDDSSSSSLPTDTPAPAITEGTASSSEEQSSRSGTEPAAEETSKSADQ